MKILVIGGAGYVGSHQVKLLCGKGYEVVVFDNLSTGFEQLVDERASLNVGDVRDNNSLKDVLKVIESCEEVTGKKANVEVGERRSGDPAVLVSDNKLAIEKLNWVPKNNDMKIIVESA